MVGRRWLLGAGGIAFSILSENFQRASPLLFEVAVAPQCSVALLLKYDRVALV